MEDPIAVAYSKVGAPPVQDRVELSDHHVQPLRTGNGPRGLPNPFHHVLARLGSRPEVKPTLLPAKLKAQEHEALIHVGHPALVLIDAQEQSGELGLKGRPGRLSLALGPGQQHHVIGIPDQSNATGRALLGAPLPVHLVQHDV